MKHVKSCLSAKPADLGPAFTETQTKVRKCHLLFVESLPNFHWHLAAWGDCFLQPTGFERVCGYQWNLLPKLGRLCGLYWNHLHIQLQATPPAPWCTPAVTPHYITHGKIKLLWSPPWQYILRSSIMKRCGHGRCTGVLRWFICHFVLALLVRVVNCFVFAGGHVRLEDVWWSLFRSGWFSFGSSVVYLSQLHLKSEC